MSDSTPGSSRPEPAVQAHRGFAGVAPENTVLAATTAAERFDADWIEIDVQPTADGTVVCFHDAALHEGEHGRGITDADGIVRETPTETVLDARVLGSDATVPTLATLLDALPADVGLNVELKNPGSGAIEPDTLLDATARDAARDRWDDFVTRVVAAIEDAQRPIVFSSTCEGAIAAADARAPDVPTAVIVRYDLEEGMAIADRHDVDAVNARDSLLLDAGHSFVADVQSGGRAVNAWTVREWETARDLAALGVDGLIADYPFLDATL